MFIYTLLYLITNQSDNKDFRCLSSNRGGCGHILLLWPRSHLLVLLYEGNPLPAGLRGRLTFGLSDDVADSKSLTDVMEGLVPGIAPLIDIVIRAGPQHVVHCVITGTCEKSVLYSTVTSSADNPTPTYLLGKALGWGAARRQDSISTMLNSCVRMESMSWNSCQFLVTDLYVTF